MNIDISRLIGAVSRTLENGTRDGRPTRVVVASRVYDTDREDLWDALTSEARIPRWFLPISGDLRLGGRYQLKGHAGGQITRCDRPEHLAVTWETGAEGGKDVSWVDVRLAAEAASRTRLVLRHEAHVPEDFWRQFGPGAVGVGWEGALMGLDLHLASPGAAVDPKQVEAWMVSPEGKDFYGRASDGWQRAAVAAGEDPAWAQTAAQRVTAFYTGAPPEGAPQSQP